MKMHTKLLGSLALSSLLAVSFTGCGGDDTAAVSTISPYQRVAVIPSTAGTDVTARKAEIDAIADKIARYVRYTDENATLDLPTNWVIAGANAGALPADDTTAESYELSDLLPIPIGTTGVTSRVIEFCNGAYATQAIATGKFHGSALPCEVSVHNDGTNVYVDMLDAEAIFNIFFTDTVDTKTEAELAAFAEMAAAVKSELRTMIKAGLDDDGGVSGSAAVSYTESTEALGPRFTQTDISDNIALQSPYIVYKYTGTGPYTLTDAHNLAQEIIDTLGDDANTADNRIPGLSASSAWRSGRPEPLSIPGVKVVEACSPKYAKKATTLGSEYITALPCEFTVYVDETDSNVLVVSFLNPNFMFGTMFEGAVSDAYMNGDITKAQVIEYSTLAEVVFADLRMIVDYAVTSYGGLTITD